MLILDVRMVGCSLSRFLPLGFFWLLSSIIEMDIDWGANDV
jgi:hypothetical protein